MIALKILLTTSFLFFVLFSFTQAAKKISCGHLFQVKAFASLTHKLHSKNDFFRPNLACGDILRTHHIGDFVKVSNLLQNRTLKLEIKGDILNEKISPH